MSEPAGSLPCPACARALRAEERAGVAAARCDEHGLWLAPDDWARLQDVLRALPPEERRRPPAVAAPLGGGEAPRPCPVCSASLTAQASDDAWRATPPVWLAKCPAHGVWLERGVLEVLVARAQRDNARRQRIRKVLQDARADEASWSPAGTAASGGLGELVAWLVHGW